MDRGGKEGLQQWEGNKLVKLAYNGSILKTLDVFTINLSAGKGIAGQCRQGHFGLLASQWHGYLLIDRLLGDVCLQEVQVDRILA